MINLLPTQEKRQIKAGRVNVLLRRYCFASLLLFALLLTTIGGLYIILANNKTTAQKEVENSKSKLAQHQSVQKSTTDFKNNLATAKNIIDGEIRYSGVITKIANTIPPGIVLESLNLDPNSFGKPMSLNALGKTQNDAIRLKTSLEQSNIFQDVHLESVAFSQQANNGYAITIAISVTLKPEVAKE